VASVTRVTVGHDPRIDDDATVGYQYAPDCGPAVLGDEPRIRSGTVVYADTEVGDRFVTGHDAVVREDAALGDDVLVGTQSVLDGSLELGPRVSVQSGVYVPPGTRVGADTFLGPCATLTNDPHPTRREATLDGPTLEPHVSVGANATVLPGVSVGARSFVAAGAVVTDDVPPETLVVGVPGEHRPLPAELEGENRHG
jgi:acetyltransferase-like isoleucine patch superfamily enzyme